MVLTPEKTWQMQSGNHSINTISLVEYVETLLHINKLTIPHPDYCVRHGQRYK
jgi:hypothetical protein